MLPLWPLNHFSNILDIGFSSPANSAAQFNLMQHLYKIFTELLFCARPVLDLKKCSGGADPLTIILHFSEDEP